MDEAKISRFRRMLAESEFDAVVAASPENSWYLSDTVLDTQKVLPERLAVVVWAKGAEPVYVVCTNEEVQARKDSWIADIRGYVEYQKSPMELAAEALSEMGASRGRIGVEKHFLTAHYYLELASFLPGAELVEATSLFDRVRAIKTDGEVSRLEAAALVTDRAIRRGFESARPGMTEKQISSILAKELIEGGADIQAFQTLAAGVRTLSTHERAGGYVLQSGDLMRTDFGGIFPGGFYSDIARTMCVGIPSKRQIDVYSRVWEEHQRLIEMLRPGAVCSEIFYSHKEHWDAKGWPMKRPHIGHGIGIGLHEYPVIMPSEKAALEPGMCICMEPTNIVPGVEKYHIEDLVLITESGNRILSRGADWSYLLAPGG